jgi:2,4-diketo-3-deoxy-L-fuconate hydrolase
VRLARIGAPGAERAVVLVTDDTYVDVTDEVGDFNEAFFGGGGMTQLGQIVAGRLASASVPRSLDPTRSCASD